MRRLKDIPGLTQHDCNNIKGALRRVFSRSELRKKVWLASFIEHSDPKRKAVKQWARCNICKQPDAKSNIVVDHIEPFIPISEHFDEMPLELSLIRLWCDPKNLQAVCKTCHKAKSKEEAGLRKPYRRKPVKSSAPKKPRKKKSCA